MHLNSKRFLVYAQYTCYLINKVKLGTTNKRQSSVLSTIYFKRKSFLKQIKGIFLIHIESNKRDILYILKNIFIKNTLSLLEYEICKKLL